MLFATWFAAMFAFSMFTSSGNVELEIDHPEFNVLKSDELYFRNIRYSKYVSEEDSASGYEILRLKKLKKASNFQFKLIKNWRHRMAYIFPEAPDKEAHLLLGDQQRNLGDYPTDYHWVTALQFYNAAMNELDVRLISGTDTIVFSEAEMKLNREVIKDFLKLTHRLP